jgi:hypothetical protein
MWICGIYKLCSTYMYIYKLFFVCHLDVNRLDRLDSEYDLAMAEITQRFAAKFDT